MNETQNQILQLFLRDRVAYTRYSNLTKDLNAYEFSALVSLAGTYYKLYPEKFSIPETDFAEFLKLSKVGEAILDAFKKAVKTPNQDVQAVLTHIHRRHTLDQIRLAASNLLQAENADDSTELKDLIESMDDIIDPDSKKIDLDLSALVQDKRGFQLKLPSLQKYVGPVSGGDTLLVFARVETGKTGFVIDNSVHFLRQGAKVLHINNEDPAPRVLERYYINFFDQPSSVIFKDITTYSEKFSAQLSKHLTIVDDTGMSVGEIDRMMKRLQPDILVVDQADNLASEHDVKIFVKLYHSLRAMCKRHSAVGMFCTQSAGKAPPILTMDDVYGSLVSKQSNVDVIIGIGVDGPMSPLNKRNISIPKNKLTGQHKHFTAFYDSALMKYGE